MNNYICINDQRIELTDEQVEKIRATFGVESIRLSDVPVKDVVKIGKDEFIVLEHFGDTAALICKNLIIDSTEFGESNNFDGSYVDAACNEFADELAAVVGENNLVTHTIDLTADDGLKDYGTVERQVSLLTAEQYRRYVEILDAHHIDQWWWLATPHSTAAHGNDSWVKCVPPSGDISHYHFSIDIGVRPFCILKSNIFVSK